jgi:hypothetical protein
MVVKSLVRVWLVGPTLAVLAAFPLADVAFARETCPRQVVECCAFPPPPEALGTDVRSALGFQVWMSDLVAPSAERASSLRPGAFRYAAGPSWARLPPLPVDADDAMMARFVESAFAGDGAAVEHAARVSAFVAATGAKAHLILWEPPRTEGEPPGPGRRLRPEALDVTARFYVAALAAYRARGFRIDAVELGNEPDGNWNIAVDASLYAQLLAAVRAQATHRGDALPPLAGPGSSSLTALQALLSDTPTALRVLAQLDAVSVHVWDDRKGGDPLALAGVIRRRLVDLGWRGPVIATEAAWTFPTPEDRALRTGANTRGPSSAGNRPDQARRSLRLLLGLLSERFSPVIYWEYRDQPWGKASYGLLDGTNTPRPLLGPFENLSRLLSRLSSPVVLADPSGSVYAVRDGQVFTAVVVLNDTAHPYTLALRGVALSPSSASLAGTGLTPCNVRGGRFSIAVPAGAATVLHLR